MFLHNFRYSVQILLKNRLLVFWTLAFPLIMAFLFNMAFSKIDDTENFSAIDIAVIDNRNFQKDKIFSDALRSLGESDDPILDIKYTDDEKKAEEMLKSREVTAVVSVSKGETTVRVNGSGINETIVRYVMDEIRSDSEVIIDLGRDKIMQAVSDGENDLDYQSVFTDIAESVLSDESAVKDNSKKDISMVTIEYYTLIAMTCLYSGLLSMTLMNHHQANVSAIGKRSTVSCSKRGAMLAGTLSAAFLIQLIGLALLYIILLFIVRVDFGSDIGYIILLSAAGSFAGLTFGTAVSVLVKKSENAKLVTLLYIVMAGCFFSGMMGITMKNIIDKNVPFINYINPAAMITDGLYALYYYSSYERFFFDLASILIFSSVMILLSIRGLRRQQYDSM